MERSKVDKFVGMLGSEHDGERANAARFLSKMAKDAGLSLVEMFVKVYGGTSSQAKPSPAPAASPPPYKPRRAPTSFEEGYRRQREKEEPGWARRRAEEERAPRPGYSDPVRPPRYGPRATPQAKIRDLLNLRGEDIFPDDRRFLERVISMHDEDKEITATQRARVHRIFKSCGVAYV
jgi:hypothetical protein